MPDRIPGTPRNNLWHIVIIFILISLCTIGLSSSFDPDFGWHLYLAEQIHQSGHLIQNLVGYWSFTNSRLIDHQWLTHYLLGWYSSGYDYTLLVILAGVLALVVYLSAYFGLIKLGYSRSISLLVTALMILPLPIVFGVRVQLLLLVGTALLWYVVPRISQLGWRRATYFAIFTLGTNLHGGFLLLATIPLATEAYPLVEAWQRGERGANIKPEVIKYLLTMCCVALGLMTSPYGISYWQLVISYTTDNYYKNNIQEWQPITAFSPTYLAISLPLAASAFILLSKIRRRTSVPLPYLILILIWAYLGLRYNRFYPILLLISGPILSEACALSVLDNHLATNGSAKKIILSCWIAIVAIVVAQAAGDFSLHPMGWPLNPSLAYGYPGKALSYIKSNDNQTCQGHLLNSYNWGGYILGFSDQTVFIDGRGPQLKLPNGQTLLQEYNKTNNPSALPTLVSQFGIRCVLAQVPQSNGQNWLDTLLTKLGGKLPGTIPGQQTWINYFGSQPNWTVVYSDSFSKVYVLSPATNIKAK
jgi:hypothetical protein